MFDRRKGIMVVGCHGTDPTTFEQALAACGAPGALDMVAVDALLAHLHGPGGPCRPCRLTPPTVILVDAAVSPDTALEALAILRADARLMTIPVVVLTATHHSGHILNAYRRGANSVAVLTGDAVERTRVLTAIVRYWFDIARVPAAA